MQGKSLTWQQHLTRAAYALGVAIAVNLYHNPDPAPRQARSSVELADTIQCWLSHYAEKAPKMRKNCDRSPKSSLRAAQSLKAQMNLL